MKFNQVRLSASYVQRMVLAVQAVILLCSSVITVFLFEDKCDGNEE